MDHRVHTAQGVAKGGWVSQIAEGDLDAHALDAQPAGIAHQAADLGAFGEQPAQQRGADQAGRAGKQEHDSYNMHLPRGEPPAKRL